MNADIDHSRSSRRPRPEVAVYRPGSGPLKKSSSNVENIQPTSSSQGTSRSDIESGLSSSLRNVSIRDEGSHKTKERVEEVHALEPKSRKPNNHRHDRNPNRNRSEAGHQQQNSSERKSEPKEPAVGVKQTKQPLQNGPDKSVSGSNQDLRQLLIEKRLQRNNDSPSTGPAETNPPPSQQSNGKQKNDSRRKEDMKNGHHSGPVPPNNAPQPVEPTTGLSRHSDKRSSGRRRNDRKPCIESSLSDGHLVALTNNNASISNVAITSQSSKSFEERKITNVEDADRGKNGREKRDGNFLKF